MHVVRSQWPRGLRRRSAASHNNNNNNNNNHDVPEGLGVFPVP